jgi:hypothetical protein
MTSLSLIGAGAKRLVERAICRCDVQVSVENDERAGYGLNNVTRSNIGFSLIDSAALKLCRQHIFNRALELRLCIGLAKAIRAFNE